MRNSNMPLIVKTGCAHSLQPKNNPCTIRKNDDYTRPASNPKHVPALRIYSRLRTHPRLRRSQGRGRQYRTHPDGTSQPSAAYFPTLPDMRQLRSIIHATRQSLARQQQPQDLDKGLDLITTIKERLVS